MSPQYALSSCAAARFLSLLYPPATPSAVAADAVAAVGRDGAKPATTAIEADRLRSHTRTFMMAMAMALGPRQETPDGWAVMPATPL
jgi:hypothetical protein